MTRELEEPHILQGTPQKHYDHVRSLIEGGETERATQWAVENCIQGCKHVFEPLSRAEYNNNSSANLELRSGTTANEIYEYVDRYDDLDVWITFIEETGYYEQWWGECHNPRDGLRTEIKQSAELAIRNAVGNALANRNIIDVACDDDGRPRW